MNAMRMKEFGKADMKERKTERYETPKSKRTAVGRSIMVRSGNPW